MPLTVFRSSHHWRQLAADTDTTIDFGRTYARIDFLVLNNAALVSFSGDGSVFSLPREYPAGVIASLDRLVRAIRFRNAVALAVATLDADLFFDPVEVVGAPTFREQPGR